METDGLALELGVLHRSFQVTVLGCGASISSHHLGGAGYIRAILLSLLSKKIFKHFSWDIIHIPHNSLI